MDEVTFENCNASFTWRQMAELAFTFMKSLKANPEDEDLQLDCLIALCQITDDVFRDIKDAEEYFGKYFWLKEINTAMTNFPEKAEVQHTACQCLFALLNGCPSLCQYIGDDTGVFPVSQNVMNALKNHLDSPAMFQSACKVISLMSSHCELLQQEFIRNEIQQPILRKMSSSTSTNEQIAGLDAIFRLCQSEIGFKKTLLKEDILAYIISVLETFPNIPEAVEQAIILLATLATDLEVVRQQCIVEEIPLILLGVLKLSSHEESLVEVTFETLGVICASAGVPDIIRKSDGLRVTISAMEIHRTNLEIQKKGIVLLQLLVTNHLLNKNIFASLVKVIKSAMVTFHLNVDIQTEACVILHVLAENNEKVSVDLVNLNIQEQFFKIFENFPNDEGLLDIASACVYLLACTQDLKNPMLLSMCALGSFKAVECLIQLGANVNCGEDTKTPLCLACRANNLELVNYLLTQGVADVHTALALCLDINRHNIAGFLLKHMGHDEEAGTITLTGLNLGSLQVEWLTPSLMGNAIYLSRLSSNQWWYLVEKARCSRLMRRRLSSSFCSTIGSETESGDDVMGVSVWGKIQAGNLTDPPQQTSLRSSPVSLPGLASSPEYYGSRSSLDSEDYRFKRLPSKRLRSVSGASIPYSSDDPRVVVALEQRKDIILPDPRSDEAFLLEENDSILELDQIPESQSKLLRKTRSSTAIGITTPRQLNNLATAETKPISQSYIPTVSRKPLKKSTSNSALQSKPPAPSGTTPRHPVHRLDLSQNEISNVDPLAKRTGILSPHLKSIKNLELSYNKLDSLPKDLSKAMPRLTHLALKHNNFHEIPACVLTSSSLEWLDLSYNKIAKIAKPKSSLSSFVSHLNLSNNKIDELPAWLGDAFKLLTSLDLSHNLLYRLNEVAIDLKKLKSLDLSNNTLQVIPAEFMSQMKDLETFKASHNKLKSLPDSVAPFLFKLVVVKLTHNRLVEKPPFYLTKFVLFLPNVHTVDLSENSLYSVASPLAWASQSLKDLDVSSNKINQLDLTKGVAKWAFLSRLDLSRNHLRQVPKGIGQLKNLGQLNLSGNSKIATLPDEMGNLNRLWEFLHTDIKLDMNASILRGRTRDLVGHLHARLRNSAPFPQRKLVVCGPRGTGKSTLLRSLVSSKTWKKIRVEKRKTKNTSDCLEVQKWMLQEVKADCKCCSRKNVTLTLRVWEFPGFEASVCVHRCFLSERDLHLLVYDASAKVDEMEQLQPWLANIHDQCPTSGVLMVGTHVDKIPAAQQKNQLKQVSEFVKRIHATSGLPEIRGHFVVNCLKNDDKVDELARRLLNHAMACNTRGHEIQSHRVPKSFLRLQEAIETRLSTLNIGATGVVHLNFLLKIVQEMKLDISKDEVNEAILFLRQSGLLVNYAKPADKLNELFFLWPAGLADLLAHLVQFFEATKDMGLIQRDELCEIIVKEGLSIDFLPQMLRLLEVFEIILPVTHSEFLAACRLSRERPKQLIGGSPEILRRRYTMPYFPLGFWCRLVVHLLLHTEEMIDVQQQFIMKGTDDSQTMTCTYWRKGFSAYWSYDCNFTIDLWGNVLDINVPSNQYGRILLGNLVYHIDTLIREWFPDLCGVDQLFGYPTIRKTTFCVSCQDHEFPIEDCARKARSVSFIECPLENSKKNLLQSQAPDVMLSHIHQRYLIREHELNYEKTPESLLGEGGYGSVYRAKYKDKNVAAKVFKTQLECESGLEYLEQEVRFLARLRHPSIIDLIGMCLRPVPVAVIELAPLGSLNAIFRRQQTLSRGIQHRIAMQVAEGLAFLHSCSVIYRDLKPHNILIFSLAAGTLINAKISDFGSSRYATPFGFIAAEGTPGYRAPEVARGDVTYNEKADIFSLGMLLYELATGGKQPFNNLKFRSELDEAVINGRPVEPIIMADSPPWPDMQDLLDNMLVAKPECRPTADQVYERLSGPEFISLKNDIAVCKGQTVECMAVRCYSAEKHSKMEVWVGSGASDWSDFKEKRSEPVHTSQLSRFDLSSTKPKGCKGTVLQDGRIMAIIAIGESMILVGTQTGNLWVYDASKETFLYPMARLPDSLLCLRHTCIDNKDLVFAGLANGQLALYKTSEFSNPPRTVRIIDVGTAVCCQKLPMLCMTVAKRRLFCALGHNIVALKLDQTDIFPEYSWSVNSSTENHKGVVSNMVVDKQGMWSSTKGSSHVQLWDLKTRELRGHFDCEDLAGSEPCEVSARELRVVSLLIHNNVLWVGTGGGEILLVDTHSMTLLMTMCRHKFAVRCLKTAVLKESGKPISLVLSGGLGFIPRQSSSRAPCGRDFGYVLVWDSGIHEEAKELEEYQTKRKEWVARHTNR